MPPGPRHEPGWDDQRGEEVVLAVGDRMSVACECGPSWTRLEVFSTRLEI